MLVYACVFRLTFLFYSKDIVEEDHANAFGILYASLNNCNQSSDSQIIIHASNNNEDKKFVNLICT